MSVIHFSPFRDPFGDLDRLTSQLVSGTRTPALMPMDVWRADQGYHVLLDLPGIDPGSIELSVDRNTLTVQAQRQAEHHDEDQVLVAERPQGSFSRQLVLGDGVDTEQVSAEYNHGVLHLRIPVKQSSQPRRIDISEGTGQERSPQVITAAQHSDEQAAPAGAPAPSGQSGPVDQSG